MTREELGNNISAYIASATMGVTNIEITSAIMKDVDLYAPRLTGTPAKPAEDWRDDPSADERWNAGLDFGMVRFCEALGVDPKSVNWDAATETVDGDVSAVIGNILRTKFGEDFDPETTVNHDVVADAVYHAILSSAPAQTMGEPVGYAPYHPKHGWRIDLSASLERLAECYAMRNIESAAQQGWTIQPLYAAQPPAAPVETDRLLQQAVIASGTVVQDHLPCSAATEGCGTPGCCTDPNCKYGEGPLRCQHCGKTIASGIRCDECAESSTSSYVTDEPQSSGVWQPIDTAPLDGTRVLLFQPGRGAFEGWWKNDWPVIEQYWMDDADSEPSPTHWQPTLALPRPNRETSK